MCLNVAFWHPILILIWTIDKQNKVRRNCNWPILFSLYFWIATTQLVAALFSSAASQVAWGHTMFQCITVLKAPPSLISPSSHFRLDMVLTRHQVLHLPNFTNWRVSYHTPLSTCSTRRTGTISLPLVGRVWWVRCTLAVVRHWAALGT